jgi:hypothetical protein
VNGCTVDGCENSITPRGRYCSKHYWRLRKYGDLNYQRPAVTPLERFHAAYDVDPTSECWIWRGAKTQGYGMFQIGQKTYRAHRWGYQQLVGPVPDDLVMDHLCRTPACVNPSHLEPVTSRVNTIDRGMGERAILHREQQCRRGHSVTGDNLYVPPSHPTWRQCRECLRDRTRVNQRARRAKAEVTA